MKQFWQRSKQLIAFTAGAASVALFLLLAGEAFLRSFPPRDFRPYLGDASGLAGPFRPDERFGVQYRSWQVFADDYHARLEIGRAHV